MSDGALCSPLLVTHHSLLECKGCLIFNNTEEVQPHYGQFAMVWLGLDCMYRMIAIEEFGGNREQHKR